MGRILSESLGTFLLVLAALMGNNLAAALAFAAALWSLSAAPTGAFNPAATLALGLRGRLRPKWVAALIVAQFSAALLAAVVTGLLAGHDAARLAEDAPGPVPAAWLGTLAAEGMGTAGLTLVLLVALASRRAAGSTVAPLFAGLGLFALLEIFRTWMAFMNPAVLLAWGFHDLVSSLRAASVAPALASEAIRFGAFLPWAALVMLAQVLGALAGTLLFRLTHPGEDRP